MRPSMEKAQRCHDRPEEKRVMRQAVYAVITAALLMSAWGVPAWAAVAPPSPDQALALQVNTALRRDRYLAYRHVRADAKHGEVVLMGSVLTNFEKAHAAKVAGGVPGVKSVKNQILVERQTASDENDLARRIREALSRDPTVHVTELAIESAPQDGVILQGIVDSAEMKDRIGKVAAGVKGVAHVVNNLEVEQAEHGALPTPG
jgi:hyperosmotically inducible periplasmic protein